MKLLGFLLIFSINLIQCKSNMAQPTIEAIDEEFNQNAEFNLQYFEISNYETLPIDNLISNLSVFANENKKSTKNSDDLILFFYCKKLFNSYKNKIQESANENEFGGLIGHDEDLIAKVWYKANHGNKIQKVFIYEKKRLIKKSEFK